MLIALFAFYQTGGSSPETGSLCFGESAECSYLHIEIAWT